MLQLIYSINHSKCSKTFDRHCSLQCHIKDQILFVPQMVDFCSENVKGINFIPIFLEHIVILLI